jgi:hypothetical protein
MTRRRKISIAIVIALMTVVSGTALALSSISFTTGTVAKYDFGGFGPGFPIPATMQIQKFTLKPGETIPWHFHKAVSTLSSPAALSPSSTWSALPIVSRKS